MTQDLRSISLQCKAFLDRVDGLGRQVSDSREFDLLHQIELLCRDVVVQINRAEGGDSLEASLDCIVQARGMLAAEQNRFDTSDEYKELPLDWHHGLRQDIAALGSRLTARIQQLRHLIKLRDEGPKHGRKGEC
ncbi:MAG: hypothetical protein JRF33_26720 [Deltaproteobacteria bacterium]|nr:hypothetical protein [Deltaproteobacteria bacterium]